jgi:two-component system chemotaxis response regulator CheB
MPKRLRAVVIGGSAGALDVLQAVLPALPATFQLPVAVVVHVLPSRPSGLAEVLGQGSALAVREANDKERFEPGTVYIASPNYHLLLEKDGHFSLSVDELVNFSRPAIDVLFESAADAFGPELVGVLLSGANEDGARGLLRIQRAGGTTVVQSPDTALARQMPEAALRLLGPDHVIPSNEIGPLLRELARVHGATALS